MPDFPAKTPRPDEADLLAFVEGESLPRDRELSVAKALEADPALARKMERMRADRAAFRALPDVKAPPGLMDAVEAALQPLLERQVRESVGMGARVLTGGGRGDRKGWYYQPTVLADVTENMPVFKEETFGPVAAVVRVRDADEAVRVANDSAYGLGANLWTRDLALGERLARRIESGSVFVNGMVASDPRLPFGGVKRSGYGRELSSYGIKEFVNIQTIWIAEGSQAASGPQSE